MVPVSRLARVALLSVVGLSVVRPADAQYFGKNKVEYVDFDFKVIATSHFDVYHYASEEDAARIAARLAERWYARLSVILDHDLDGRQPLILYGSHPEFAQTNVVSGLLGEGIGGVTESARRRIVMPFAPTLAETDRVLGHEIAHAFQFDIMRRHHAGGLPRWAMEGMAQYLALGPHDVETDLWLRDAVAHDLLPQRASAAARTLSPYRYGHTFWAYLGGRFGDEIIGKVLRTRAGGLDRRLRQLTGLKLEEVFAQWRTHLRDRFPERPAAARLAPATPLLRHKKTGRLYLGPALSPDGRDLLFFSEEDRLSIDLFLTDTRTGTVRRKLATEAANPRFESLQPLRSAGAWSARGDRIAFAAIQRGEPTLVFVDVREPGREREIRFAQFGQILSPAWSPTGEAVAFSALRGGVTDLYVYDLTAGTLRQLTNDVFADLQPAWSPDGRELVFVTDRYTTDLETLTFGPSGLARLEVASGRLNMMTGVDGARHLSPQWSPDGASVFFVADPQGAGNVYRVVLESGALHQLTDGSSSVAGLTGSSPALSVAQQAPMLAFTRYRAGHYEIDLLEGATALAGRLADPPGAVEGPAPAHPGLVSTLIGNDRFGLPATNLETAQPYRSALSLEAIGQPYLSTGGGPFGSFIRGGGSLFFGDMLGERMLGASIQAGNRFRDLAVQVQYLNRERRWNWGGLVEIEPSLYRTGRRLFTRQEGEAVITNATSDLRRTQLRLAGLVAYPFGRSRRVELSAGVRHAAYQRVVRARVSSAATHRILSTQQREGPGEAPTTVGEASLAFVGDTAVFGPTGPLVGTRYRMELGPAVGDFAFARVLLDYRRYTMPIRPVTLAVRLLHAGRYGPDADDRRLSPTFLGARQYVRGYGWDTRSCQWNAEGECEHLEALLGSRLLVGNLELRFPIPGLIAREVRYGPLPVDGFVFADGGAAWSRRTRLQPTLESGHRRHMIGSAGAGVRASVFGWPLEAAAVRTVQGPNAGWSFDVSLRAGF
jgi:hypothetical protein